MTDVVEGIDTPAVDDEASTEGQELTIEALAREAGWKPQDEAGVKPESWVDAPTWIRNTGAKLRETQARNAQLREEAKRIGATSQRLIETERERAKAELLQAREAGDVDAAIQAKDRLDRVTKPDNDVIAWVERNSWFKDNPKAQALAKGVSDAAAAEGRSVTEQLEEAEQEVRRVYPHLFSDAQSTGRQTEPEPRRVAPQVQGGARAVSQPRTGPKGFNELPPAAKDAARAFANALPPGTAKEKRDSMLDRWTKTYWEEHQ